VARDQHRAARDLAAPCLLESLASAGIRVPRDMSILGWDDSPLARLSHLDLTTAQQDPVELSRLAVERRVGRLRGESVGDRELVLSPGLGVRTSTAAPRQRLCPDHGSSRTGLALDVAVAGGAATPDG
jgi:DNA-binding LacI/PurR family transcriptional regulator